MIDRTEKPANNGQVATIVVGQPQKVEKPGELSPLSHAGDDINRWRQIVDLADNNEPNLFANTPNEEYASVEAVTVHAGGGVNGPKHPYDLRVKDPSIYPNQQGF